jgi:hypothetical protein
MEIIMDKINVDKQKLKQSHNTAAEHYKKAAEHHDEAAKQHEAGNLDKGNSHAYMAHGFSQKAIKHASDASTHTVGVDSKQD